MYSWGFVSESNIPFSFDNFSETSSTSSGTSSRKPGTNQDISPRNSLLGTSPVSSIQTKSETNLSKLEVSSVKSSKSGTNLTNGSTTIVPAKEDESHDFVPHVVRVSNLLLNRVSSLFPNRVVVVGVIV